MNILSPVTDNQKKAIIAAIENGTIEKYVSELAGFEMRTKTKREFKGEWTLEMHIDNLNANVEAIKMEISEPIQNFVISIAYSEVKLREKVKSLKGTWNADTKTWTVKCRATQLGVLENKVVGSTVNPSPRYNSIFGASSDLGY